MQYRKPALTYEQQADQLLKRGLKANRELLIERLQRVNYYRLSGYWFPFRQFPNETFRDGTDFETIWQRYAFDRHLRLLLLDGIERVEIAIRTEVTYEFSHRYDDAFGYLEAKNLPQLSVDDHAALIQKLRWQYSHSKERFASHFHSKYGDDHDLLPIWMITELMTFGNLLTVFRGCAKPIQRKIGEQFGVADRVIVSWFRALNATRNVCAHHARLWNRELGYKPTIPRKDKRWHQPIAVGDNRIFAILTIIKYLIDMIAPQRKWTSRLLQLLGDYPDIPRKDMGFMDNWQQVPFWSDTAGRDICTY